MSLENLPPNTATYWNTRAPIYERYETQFSPQHQGFFMRGCGDIFCGFRKHAKSSWNSCLFVVSPDPISPGAMHKCRHLSSLAESGHLGSGDSSNMALVTEHLLSCQCNEVTRLQTTHVCDRAKWLDGLCGPISLLRTLDSQGAASP